MCVLPQGNDFILLWVGTDMSYFLNGQPNKILSYQDPKQVVRRHVAETSADFGAKRRTSPPFPNSLVLGYVARKWDILHGLGIITRIL